MLFAEWKLANVTARNRLVRSATYEGMADEARRPAASLGDLYADLAAHDVGTIITGFCYVHRRGRAMHPGQCGIDSDRKIAAWEAVVSKVRSVGPPTVMLMQLAHAGLQTRPEVTGFAAIAPSVRRSPYFKTTPVRMTESDVREAVGQFRSAAVRAKRAGFDGVQLHAAHGYLLHQFLSPFVNDRTDRWGGSTDGRFAFLHEVICDVKAACGDSFPVFAKLSVPDGHPVGVDVPGAIEYVRRMQAVGVEAVEISYGTMDAALSIFRGGVPIDRVLKHNMLFCRKPAWLKWLWKKLVFPGMRAKFLPFRENYNLDAAAAVRQATGTPVIVVGGVRSLAAIERILESGQADAVAMCRPLIREPDLASRFRRGEATEAACTNCNACAVMADSTEPLRCYQKGKDHGCTRP